MGSFAAKLLNSLGSIGKTSYSAGKVMSSLRQEVSSKMAVTIMHSNKLRLIVLSSIYALAYLQSYGKPFVMSKPYSSRAFNFGVPDEPRGRVGCSLTECGCKGNHFFFIIQIYSNVFRLDLYLFINYLQVSGPEGVRRNALRAQRPKSPHFEELAQA